MFNLKEYGSRVGTEILAGLTTFLTVAYILVLIPGMLKAANMPADEVVVSIAICSALGAFIMGLVANRPYVLAPGVGAGAFFAFGMVSAYGVSWQVALAATLIAGGVFLLLTLVGLRNLLYHAIPPSVRMAAMVGIGLFLTIIGFEGAGITVDHPATLITLGKLTDPKVLLALAGVVLIAALMANRVAGAFVIGIVAVTAAAWLVGLAPMPTSFMYAIPEMPQHIIMAMDFSQITSTTFASLVIAFFFLTVLDTAGSLSGLGRLGGMIDPDGRVFGSTATYATSATGIILSSVMGTSPNAVFIESAVGMQAGGRTGLTAIVVGLLFLIALFFVPVFTAIPVIATAPALIVAGGMMMRGARDLDWTKAEDIIPAFLTMASMAFTFNVAHGISLGVISHVLIYTLSGRARELNASMMIVSIILAIYLGAYL